MTRIILASKSARRRKLLEKAGIDFVAEESTVTEKIDKSLPPEKLVIKLASEKAMDIAKNHPGKNVIIIGADTVVEFRREILGKPKTKQSAVRMLRKLSGNMHKVYTGLILLNPYSNKRITHVEITKVYFRELTNKEIEKYVASGEPFGKAGSYAIQEKGALFVKRIEGDYYNIVGLPLCFLIENLKLFKSSSSL